MRARGRPVLRGAALIALLTLALGIAACGGSDESAGDAGAAAGPGGQSPEARVQSSYEEYVDAFYEKDPKVICDLLSRKAQRSWAAAGDSCESGLEAFFDSGVQLFDTRPTVTRVEIDGSRAVVRTSKNGRPTHPGPLVREDGEWKVDAGGGP